ncbi:unnamed protein product [Polarella glacialis]|uniref:Uncharacterized protein n=1 Tax=Polarella glacialis TaxID=89957 RepID=A0A813HYF7_POLGL|nr:unnamed protein product [Polarella glacialis]
MLLMAEQLAADPDLETLDLEGQSLGKKGARKLAKELLEHKSLKELNLACNDIGDAGAEAIAAVLQRNQVLRSVNLRNNKISDDGARCLADALCRAARSSPGGWLTELSLGHNSLGDAAMQSLSQALAQSSNLRELDLSSCGEDISGSAWEKLAALLQACSSLTSLKLRDNNIGDASAATLALALAGSGTCRLKELDLSRCSLGDKGALCIFHALRTQVDTDSGGSDSGLKRLNLPGNHFGPGIVEGLAAIFQSGAGLEELDLSRCNLGAEAGMLLGPALAKGTGALRELRLCRNGLGIDGARGLSEGLASSECRLQSLSLRENHLDDAGIGAISEALKSNRALKELELCGNGIGDLGASSLGLALVMNMKLSVLNLQDNLIGDPGADGLAVGIERNKVLQELDLGGNGRLGNAGVGRLAQALGKNSTLRSLGLQGSSADPEAVQCLEELAADPAARRTGESDEVFETPLEGDAFGLDSQLSCGSEESSSSHSDDSESDHEREVAGL